MGKEGYVNVPFFIYLVVAFRNHEPKSYSMKAFGPFMFVILVLAVVSGCRESLRSDGGLIVRLEIPKEGFAQSVVDTAIQVLKNRVLLCSPYATIEVSSDREEIYIEMPEVRDTALVPDYLLKKGDMYIYETYEYVDLMGNLLKANEYLTSKNFFGYDLGINHHTNRYGYYDTVAVDTQSLFFVLVPAIDYEKHPVPGATVGYSIAADTPLVNTLLNKPDVRGLFPHDLRLVWGYESGGAYPLVALKVNDQALHLTRVVLKDAKVGANGYSIIFQFQESYHKVFERMTSENLNKCLAHTLDNKVLSAANVMSVVSGGSPELSGHTDPIENLAIAGICIYGQLNVPFHIKELKVVKAG